MIDFTQCPIDSAANYGGSDQKRGVFFRGKRFMLKMSDRVTTDRRNALNSSYSNSVFSEYICCHILNMHGYPAQNTLLGTITIRDRVNGLKDVPVVACENFIPDGHVLVEFKNIEDALLAEKPGRVPRISDIKEIFAGNNTYFTTESGALAEAWYWDIFVFDALFGNFDRHANNWGYLVCESTGQLSQAPVYDCGSSLYPQLSDDGLWTVLRSDSEQPKRIDVFPHAALLLPSGEKAGYKDFLLCTDDEMCLAAIRRVVPKLDMCRINAFIDAMEEISDVRKTFYKTMLSLRYEKILIPSYERAKLLVEIHSCPSR